MFVINSSFSVAHINIITLSSTGLYSLLIYGMNPFSSAKAKNCLDSLRFTYRSGRINKKELHKHILISFTALLNKPLSVSQMMQTDSDDVRSCAAAPVATGPVRGEGCGISQ